MKKLTYGTLFLISWIILNLTAGWAQQPYGPKMELKEKYFDAKHVKEGQIIEHTFTVFNRGDRPLEIKKVQPGWGCAVARFDRTIPPGGEGKITLRIKTRGYQGVISKSAKVYTNDPRKKIKLLTIKAFIKVPIYLSHRYVYLTGIADRKITKTIMVKANEKNP